MNSRKTLFLSVVSLASLSVFSGMAQAQNSCQACAIALDPQASQAFSVSNGAQVSLSNCGIRVNSTSSSAFYATGGAKVNATSIQVVGGSSISNGASATPVPQTGATAAADPFAGTPAPAIGSCLTHPDYTTWGTNGQYTLSPGTYCNGLAISNGVTANLQPGVYVISGGGLQLGSGTVTGSGVTFYITGSSFTNNQIVSIGNGMSVNLSAPTSGPYKGHVVLPRPEHQ